MSIPTTLYLYIMIPVDIRGHLLDNACTIYPLGNISYMYSRLLAVCVAMLCSHQYRVLAVVHVGAHITLPCKQG